MTYHEMNVLFCIFRFFHLFSFLWRVVQIWVQFRLVGRTWNVNGIYCSFSYFHSIKCSFLFFLIILIVSNDTVWHDRSHRWCIKLNVRSRKSEKRMKPELLETFNKVDFVLFLRCFFGWIDVTFRHAYKQKKELRNNNILELFYRSLFLHYILYFFWTLICVKINIWSWEETWE